MNKKLLFYVLLFNSVFFLSGIDTTNDTARIISDIQIVNNIYTNSRFIIDSIGVAKGDRYSPEAIRLIKTKLSSMKDIIQSVKIIESIDLDQNIKLTIDINEKFPILLIPFFTYSNSTGIKPKIIIRHYNLAGYRKYLSAKIEYMPKSELFLWAKFSENADTLPDRIGIDEFENDVLKKLTDQNEINFLKISYDLDDGGYKLLYSLTDEDKTKLKSIFDKILFGKKSSYSIEANLGTSIPNYYISGIPPLGVFGGNDGTGRWSTNAYINGYAKGHISFQIPDTSANLTMKFGMDEYRLSLIPDKNNPNTFIGTKHLLIPYYSLSGLIFDDKINASYTPSFSIKYTGGTINYSIGDNIHRFDIRGGISMNYPFFKTGLRIIPYFDLVYLVGINRDFNSDLLMPNFNSDYLVSKTGVELSIPITEINATITPGISFTFTRNSTISNEKLSNYLNDIDTAINSGIINIYASFSRVIKQKNITNETIFRVSYNQPLFNISEKKNTPAVISPPELVNFSAGAVLTNNFEWKYFKEQRFLMSWIVFANYNSVQAFGGSYDSSSYRILLNDITYIRGWAGAICKLQLAIPFFYFTTTRFFTKAPDKELNWQIDWLFFINAGLSLNDTEIVIGSTKYTIPVRVLHLLPSITIGTSIRLYPKFMASFLRIDIGLDIYRILKTRGFSGGLSLVFNIGDDI